MQNGVTEELLVFLTTLEEEKHLGRAARRLGLSAPKASRLLAEARRLFGDELFVRRGFGLTPNERATRLAQRAKHILADTLTTGASFEPAKLERVFRGACLDHSYPTVIEPLLAPFCEAAPLSSLSLRPHDKTTLSGLRSGELDFAIFLAYRIPSDFDAMLLFRTPFVYAVRPGHPLEAMLSRRADWRSMLSRYRRIRLVVHLDYNTPREGVEGPAAFDKSLADNDHTVVWTESWLGGMSLLVRSDAVMILPWRVAKACSGLTPLTVLGEVKDLDPLELSLVWHRRMEQDDAFLWLRELFGLYVRGGIDTPSLDAVQTGRLAPAAFQLGPAPALV